MDWTGNTIDCGTGNWTSYFYTLPGGHRLVLLTTLHFELLMIIKYVCDKFNSKSNYVMITLLNTLS